MRLRPLSAVALGLAVIGWTAWVAHHLHAQRTELGTLNERLNAIAAPRPNSADGSPSVGAGHSKAPSAELLRARAAVAALRAPAGGAEAAEHHPDRTDSTSTLDDLHRLMKGRLPSSRSDFVEAATVRNRGFGSPEEALETFWWHFAAPGRASLETFGKLWWSPEDQAPAGYHYEIGLGTGVGAFTGDRVAGREDISADDVVFHLEREERGSVVQEDAQFIRVGDHWVRKPVVRLIKDGQ